MRLCGSQSRSRRFEEEKKRNLPLVFATDASHSDCWMQHKVGTDRFLHYKTLFFVTKYPDGRQPRTLNQKTVRLTTNVNRL